MGLDSKLVVVLVYVYMIVGSLSTGKGLQGSCSEAVKRSAGQQDSGPFTSRPSLRRRDPLKILSAWLPREYNAALKAYTKAGFTEYVQPGSLWYQTNSDASLMYKHF